MKSKRLGFAVTALLVMAALLALGVFYLYPNRNASEPKSEKIGPWTQAGRIVLPTALESITIHKNKNKYVLTPDDAAFTSVRREAEQVILTFNAIPKCATLLESIEYGIQQGSTVVILKYNGLVRVESSRLGAIFNHNSPGEQGTSEVYILLDAQPEPGDVGLFWVKRNQGIGSLATAETFAQLKTIVSRIP